VVRKSISTSHAVVACDVCGRTLLRGEHADGFIHGGTRRTVCELCTVRAMHEGWIREGLDGGLAELPDRAGSARSLLGRLRARRVETVRVGAEPDPAFEAAPGPDAAEGWPLSADPTAPAPAPPEPETLAPPVPPQTTVPSDAPRVARSVRGVPSNADMKVARALELFNTSEHPRTVAGIGRSLGAPLVSARPSATEGSVVTVVVAWELSWYRYEVDLADEAAGARVVAQGAELAELDLADQQPNAAADERGALHPAAAVA
jgi:hypothetical protein